MAWLKHSQAPVTGPLYPQQGTQVTDTYSEWTDTSYQDDPQCLPALPRGYESCGPNYLGHMVNGISFGDQHWRHEPSYDPEPYNWAQCPPGLEETSQPHHGNVEFQALPDPTPATPMPPHRVDKGEHPSRSFFHPAGTEGNRVAALVLAGSSPTVGPDNAGTQNANKRKRDTTPGEQECETIEPTQKKRRNSEAQEHIPVGTPEVGAPRSKFDQVVLGRNFHTLARTPRPSSGATNQVPLQHHTERLELPPSHRFHFPRRRRDQTYRCHEPELQPSR